MRLLNNFFTKDTQTVLAEQRKGVLDQESRLLCFKIGLLETLVKSIEEQKSGIDQKFLNATGEFKKTDSYRRILAQKMRLGAEINIVKGEIDKFKERTKEADRTKNYSNAMIIYDEVYDGLRKLEAKIGLSNASLSQYGFLTLGSEEEQLGGEE